MPPQATGRGRGCVGCAPTWLLHERLATNALQRLAHAERPGVEVDVCPAQSEHLALAHAGADCHLNQGSIAIPLAVLDQDASLLRGGRLHRLAVWPGRGGEPGDVGPHEEPPADLLRSAAPPVGDGRVRRQPIRHLSIQDLLDVARAEAAQFMATN